MEYVVRLEQHGDRPLAVVRRLAASHELSRVVPDACGTVWNVIRSQRVSGAGRHVAVYLDGQINLEVGAEVPGPFQGDGQVVYSATPAGLVATTAHMGPYHLLGDAYAAINKWCADHQLTAAGPTWEIYGHWDDDPSKLRTDVFILLKEDGGPAG